MQYLGGKSKIRKELCNVLKSFYKDNQEYFEPFVGGAWVLQEINFTKVRIASDGNRALISMYQALQNGWIPPDYISEEEYIQIKNNNDDNDPLTAFCGFGCSFAGKWWGGYARSSGKCCYAATTKRSLLKQLPMIKDVKFIQGLYDQHIPEQSLIYCDPPYANTTNYGTFKAFDHTRFWDVMREWSKDNTVLVSEYVAPEDFVCVAKFNSRMGLRVNNEINEIRTERLFKYAN